MTANPSVSFVLSVFNGQDYLIDCIKGIDNQRFQDYEVIVIDDGSTDNTTSLLLAWRESNKRVYVFRESRNRGLTNALNLAISKSKGKFIARHDADDISSPFRIEEQVAFLNSHPNTVLVGSHCVEFVNKDNLIATYCFPDDPKLIIDMLKKGSNPLIHGSVMMRREAFDGLCEGYRFKYAQDYDLYLRLLRLGEIRIVTKTLYALRNHQARTAIQAREVKRRIRKLIMQVNGLIPWDDESEKIIDNLQDVKVIWQDLQNRILQSAPIPSDNEIQAQFRMSMIGDSLEKGYRLSALMNAFRAFRICPKWWKTWLSLPYAFVGCFLPRSLAGIWRGRSFSSHYRKPCNETTLNEIFSQ